MFRPNATGPPLPVILLREERTATAFLAEPRRRPDHDEPKGKHHGYNDCAQFGRQCE
jgi:hypothetical protein